MSCIKLTKENPFLGRSLVEALKSEEALSPEA